MVRNLLSNALKYTKRGKVLLGCRRQKGLLSIEIWDTGIGIPAAELQTIFEEYHQIDDAAQEHGRGLGLGLAIVQRLGSLLGHRIRVRSQPGKGSIFAIEVMLTPNGVTPPFDDRRQGSDGGTAEHVQRTGAILVVEDDPEVRDLLEHSLKEENYHAATAADGRAALDLVAQGSIQPDLILAVEIRDVAIPVALQDAMSRQAQAEREKQARVILRSAEAAIAGKFVEAAVIYADHPTALQLRAMNIIYETTKERGATILMPTSMVDSMNPVVALALAGQATAPQKVNGPVPLSKTSR